MPSGFTSFLFEGQPPPATSTTGFQTNQVPAWYAQYQQGLLQRADQVAAEPFQPYGGQRIAGFTDAQNQGQNYALQHSTDWQQPMQTAQGMVQQGTQFNQDNFNNYLSPYLSGVTGEIERQGWRNFDTNVGDRLQSNFIGAGGFGGQRNMQQYNNALADTQREILGQSALANQRGYESAMTNYGQGQDRMITGGQRLGALAQQQQTQDLQTGAGMEAVGRTQQNQNQQNLDLGYQDFVEQRDFPRTNVGFLNSAMRGMQMPTSSTTGGTQPVGGYGPSPLAQVAGLGALGYQLGVI